MSNFDRRYTAEQKEAVIDARLERGLTASKVSQLARDGALVVNGKALDPFEIPKESVYTFAAAEEKRRHGTMKASLASVDHADAIDVLRRRLVAAADYELRGYERAQRKGRPDPERLRQIIRCVREAAALPGPKDGRGVKPGQRDPNTGEHQDGHTRGALAGSILQSARRSVDTTETEGTAPERPVPPITQAENGTPDAHENQQTNTEPEAEPGSVELSSVPPRSRLLRPVG